MVRRAFNRETAVIFVRKMTIADLIGEISKVTKKPYGQIDRRFFRRSLEL